jgi:hypothetical protein
MSVVRDAVGGESEKQGREMRSGGFERKMQTKVVSGREGEEERRNRVSQ